MVWPTTRRSNSPAAMACSASMRLVLVVTVCPSSSRVMDLQAASTAVVDSDTVRFGLVKNMQLLNRSTSTKNQALISRCLLILFVAIDSTTAAVHAAGESWFLRFLPEVTL